MSLRLGILGLLDFAPMTGYTLKKLFDKSINNVWTANLSQIYRELAALEKGGCLISRIEAQDDRPDKKIYQITPQGKRVFLDWLSECPTAFVSPKRDEFMLKIFFGANLDRKEVIHYFERFIEDRKKSLGELNYDKDSIPRMAYPFGADLVKKVKEQELFIKFTIRRAVMMNQLLIQWAQDCINELKEK